MDISESKHWGEIIDDHALRTRQIIECLSDEIIWVSDESIFFRASVKEVVTGKAVFDFPACPGVAWPHGARDEGIEYLAQFARRTLD